MSLLLTCWLDHSGDPTFSSASFLSQVWSGKMAALPTRMVSGDSVSQRLDARDVLRGMIFPEASMALSCLCFIPSITF